MKLQSNLAIGNIIDVNFAGHQQSQHFTVAMSAIWQIYQAGAPITFTKL